VVFGQEDERVYDFTIVNPADGVSVEEIRTKFKTLERIVAIQDGVLVSLIITM